MALQNNASVLLTKLVLPVSSSSSCSSNSSPAQFLHGGGKRKMMRMITGGGGGGGGGGGRGRGRGSLVVCSSNSSSGDGNSSNTSSGGTSKKKGVPNSNYVVPLDKPFSSSYSSCITRPLDEILRDLNKRIPDNIIIKSPPPPHDDDDHHSTVNSATFIPWYHANRMLSFYAPGWCGEIRDVIFSDNGSVTVVYRVTIRGSDGEAHRESTGSISSSDGHIVDPVAAAEEIAFCRACARFGLGLYLYHEE